MRGSLIFLTTFLTLQLSYALPSGWQEIRPGGSTLCARGSAYKFLVRAGDPHKVVVSFAGGGACWDSFTCDNSQIYTDTAERTYGPVNNQVGIFDFQNHGNPYRNWTHVYIPYCTGDVHLGSSDATYTREDQSTFVIHHRGGINAKAVFNWLAANYKNVDDLNVDGCSAGSYGSVLWTPTLAQQFTRARILQFGDSGAGVLPSLFLPQWGIEKSLPAWIPSLNPARVDWRKLNIVDVYREIANFYPQARFSQFNHEQDRIQILFYAAMGGNGKDWSNTMFRNMDETTQAAANFRYFVAPGTTHCSMNNASLYSTMSDGVSLNSWLSAAVAGQDSQNVKCTQCKTQVR